MDEMTKQMVIMLRSLMLDQEIFVEKAQAELNEQRDAYATEEEFFLAVARLSIENAAQWMFSEMLLDASDAQKARMRRELNRTR